MYFTYKFTDAKAKTEGVRSNTVDMVFAYFWEEAVRTTPVSGKLAGMTNEDIGTTKELIRHWVDTHPAAILSELADFVSYLVADYDKEHRDELGN
jgi:hypothetical protein